MCWGTSTRKNVLIRCHTWLSIHHPTLLQQPEGKRAAEAAQQKVKVVEKEVLNWSGMSALPSLLPLTCPQTTIQVVFLKSFSFFPFFFFTWYVSFLSSHFPLSLVVFHISFFSPSLSGLTSPLLSLSPSLSLLLSQYIHSCSNGKSFRIHNSRFTALPSLSSPTISPLRRPLCLCVSVRVQERDLNTDANPSWKNTNKHMDVCTHTHTHTH